jgi:hypothetical protein
VLSFQLPHSFTVNELPKCIPYHSYGLIRFFFFVSFCLLLPTNSVMGLMVSVTDKGAAGVEGV